MTRFVKYLIENIPRLSFIDDADLRLFKVKDNGNLIFSFCIAISKDKCGNKINIFGALTAINSIYPLNQEKLKTVIAMIVFLMILNAVAEHAKCIKITDNSNIIINCTPICYLEGDDSNIEFTIGIDTNGVG